MLYKAKQNYQGPENFQVSAETFESATVYFSAIDGFINLVAESTPLEVSSNRDP